MVPFANVFLVLFALDAALSVLDGGLRLAGSEALAGARQLAAWVALSASLPLFLLVAAGPRLPRRIFLPPVLFLWWVALGGFPVSSALGGQPLDAVLSICQLGLAVLALVLVRGATGGTHWLLRERDVPGPSFAFGHFAKFAATTALLAPFVVSVLLAGAGAAWLRAESAGFLRVDLRGVYALERTYVRGDREVRLLAMVHAADEGFYRDVIASIPTDGTVVLAEGVTDETSRLTQVPDLGEIAETVGLTAQTSVPLPEDVTVERADVDASDLSAETVEFLQTLGAAFRSGSLREGLAIYVRYTREHGAEEVERVLAEIVDTRNAHLLERLDDALERYERAVVPWGALHMRGLEAGVLARGFSAEAERVRPVIRFW